MSDGFQQFGEGLRQMSRNLERLHGTHTIVVTFPRDENGFIGRECPEQDCLGYFKVVSGTGLTGEGLPCHCPYCGHTGLHNTFFTPEQIEYARSVALGQFADQVYNELKKSEMRSRPSGSWGISVAVTVKRGQRPSIRYYREKQLETEVICDSCTLHYAIYGVFGYCPDCRTHNSLQILSKNLELAEKEINLAAAQEGDLAVYLVGDALENAVSAFDGFGRETCRVNAGKAVSTTQAQNISFQNLSGARRKLQEQFGFDLSGGTPADSWDFACKCFQKRHLLAHKMGVIDNAYVSSTGDPQAVVGRKVEIVPNEVQKLLGILHTLGAHLVSSL